MAASSKAPTVEDDLDDLDDVLDQFTPPPPKPSLSHTSSTAKVPSSSTSTTSNLAAVAGSSSATYKTATTPPPGAGAFDDFGDDFAAELAKGMESLMAGFGDPSAAGGAGALNEEANLTEEEKKQREELFRSAWEAMLIEGMNGAGGQEAVAGSSAAGVGAGASGGDGANNFQQTIRDTMDRLRQSHETAQTEASSAQTDPLEALLSQFANMGDGELGEGGANEEELQKMLESMMGQLMSKEVLYEPLQELHEKFPTYLKDNASTLSEADKARYEAQMECINKVMAIFDDPSYSDGDPVKSTRVVELMNEMQSHGSPPTEIMGPMPPGFEMGEDGLPKMPEGCVIS